ncbi:YgiT-type zinc finger protein [Hippea sp. KM1]|uniref:YgiT-type zinc finger protein n=1 Tax=Hippea sp. KM1 TaxID=944481 RepID=UPI00046CD510|nr:YgiT-type zinc finger protein [Hippea sp. KM1]
MRCKFCGREMRRVVTPFRRPVKGEMITVKDIEVYRCPECGAVFVPKETVKHIGRKTGEKLLKVAKERGRIRDEKEHLREMREKTAKDIEDAIRRGEIKKREDAPMKVFT